MLCAILALCAVVTLIPVNAFAAEASGIVQIARAEVGTSGRPNKYTYFTGRVGGTYSYAWCGRVRCNSKNGKCLQYGARYFKRRGQ